MLVCPPHDGHMEHFLEWCCFFKEVLLHSAGFHMSGPRGSSFSSSMKLRLKRPSGCVGCSVTPGKKYLHFGLSGNTMGARTPTKSKAYATEQHKCGFWDLSDFQLPIKLEAAKGSYCRLRKVGIWAWDDFCWFSFFSRLWGWRTVIFQPSDFYCISMEPN